MTRHDVSRLFWRRATLARALSDAELTEIAARELSGPGPDRIVVAGGGARTSGSERRALPKGRLHADVYLDINPSRRPSALTDLTGRWPLRDDTADLLISTWVLEHLPDPFHFMSEAARVTRPGGLAVVAVPFLYQVHASPRDYLRFTGEALHHLAARAGFLSAEVREVGGGPTVAVVSLLWRLLVLPGAGLLAYGAARTIDGFLAGASRVAGRRGEYLSAFPIANILVARR